MKIKNVEYYEFNELSKEVKQKVIDKYYESYEYPFLEEELLEELKYFDDKTYFSYIELQYSLSCCQGDGVSFNGEFAFKKWIDKNYKYKTSVKNALCKYICDIRSTGNKGRYAYCSKRHIEISYNCYNKEYERIDKIVDKIVSDIQNYYVELCTKLEKSGYDTLDYRMSLEEFDEHCQANEYNFLIDGTMVNY